MAYVSALGRPVEAEINSSHGGQLRGRARGMFHYLLGRAPHQEVYLVFPYMVSRNLKRVLADPYSCGSCT